MLTKRASAPTSSGGVYAERARAGLRTDGLRARHSSAHSAVCPCPSANWVATFALHSSTVHLHSCTRPPTPSAARLGVMYPHRGETTRRNPGSRPRRSASSPWRSLRIMRTSPGLAEAVSGGPYAVGDVVAASAPNHRATAASSPSRRSGACIIATRGQPEAATDSIREPMAREYSAPLGQRVSVWSPSTPLSVWLARPHHRTWPPSGALTDSDYVIGLDGFRVSPERYSKDARSRVGRFPCPRSPARR